jgi:hypothetical protein
MEDAMRLKLAVASVVGILFTALSAAPASATTNSVTIGSPVTLTNRVLVTVPVTVVCDPIADIGTSTLFVTVTQASGQAVATGSAIDQAFPPQPPLFTCDSVTQNNFVMNILPDMGSPPFHGGGAIVQVFFSIFSFTSGSETGSSGPTPVTIRG